MSANIKIVRAQKHLTELSDSVRSYLGARPFDVYKEDENGDLLYRLRINVPVPAEDWAAILGDVFHNLRSSLDIRVCELIEQNQGTVTKNTAFPFFKNKEDFDTNYRSKISGISESHALAVTRLQPYPGGNEVLYELHNLDITDKHHHLLISGAAQRGLIIDFSSNMSALVGRTIPPMPVMIAPADTQFPLEDGAILYMVPARARAQENHPEPVFAFDIAYAKDVDTVGQPLLPKLQAIQGAVADAIATLA